MKKSKTNFKANSNSWKIAGWDEIRRSISAGVHYFNMSHSRPFDAQDMEDITQEVVIRVFKNKGLYDPSKSGLNTWLSKITYNCCMDYLRNRSAITFVSIEGVDRADVNPEDLYIEKENREFEERRHQWLDRSIRSLKPRERNVMRLTLKGLRPKEICKTLNVTPNSVSITKSRAKKALCAMASL